MSNAKFTGLENLLFMESNFADLFGQYAKYGCEHPDDERLSVIDDWLKYANSIIRGERGGLNLADLEQTQAEELMEQLETSRAVASALGLRCVVVSDEQQEMIVARSNGIFPSTVEVA